MNKTSIFSNSGKYKDTLYLGMLPYAKHIDVYIASAFFTKSYYIEEFLKQGCTIHLIVRLGFPTSASALRKIYKLPNVLVRFYTSEKFHPKLYMFGDEIAFIGSSNLTDGGFASNNELNVSINGDHDGFERVRSIFNNYWANAVPLTDEVLTKYEAAVKDLEKENKEYLKRVAKDLPNVEVPNDKDPDLKKKKNPNVYVENTQREYQTFLACFKSLEQQYINSEIRIAPEDVLPLRLEIHRFINYIKDVPMKGIISHSDSYPTRKGEDLSLFVRNQINNFHNSDPNKHKNLSLQIEKYNKLTSALGTERKIQNIASESLLEALLCVNAFKERIRHKSSDFDEIHTFFFSKNDVNRVKESLIYLLYGKEEFTLRVANCCESDNYRLFEFGRHSMKELYGWLNKEGTPLYNNRVAQSMGWLGYGKL